MNRVHSRLRGTILLFLASANILFAQGNLTPPGAPAPTMKSLNQIASTGIPLNTTNTPGDASNHFIINQAGSYFLTSNLDVTKTNGIRVNVPGVTIDLNGFEIARSSGTGGDGITIRPEGHRCTVRNGSLSGFANGIDTITTTARGCVFRDISAANCTNIGIRAGEGTVLESCRAHDCSGVAGILTANSGTLSNCVAVRNSAGNAIQAGAGSTLSNCAASNNTGTNAFSVGGGSTLMNCAATSNVLSGTGILTGIGCSLSNCTAQNNAGTYGINAGAGSSLNRCTGSNNTGLYGILSATGSSFIDCSAAANTSSASTSGGFLTGSGSTVTNCNANANESTAGTLTGNTGIGFDLGGGSTIQNCVAFGNRGGGINLSADSFARSNTCANNGASSTSAGIHATSSDNRIEGNKLSLNYLRGLAVDGSGSIIIKNSSTNLISSQPNWVIAAGNSFGVIVDDIGADDFIFGDSAAGTFGSPNAWANFSH